MANYLKHENQLIVWPVLKQVTENEIVSSKYWIENPIMI